MAWFAEVQISNDISKRNPHLAPYERFLKFFNFIFYLNLLYYMVQQLLNFLWLYRPSYNLSSNKTNYKRVCKTTKNSITAEPSYNLSSKKLLSSHWVLWHIVLNQFITLSEVRHCVWPLIFECFIGYGYRVCIYKYFKLQIPIYFLLFLHAWSFDYGPKTVLV